MNNGPKVMKTPIKEKQEKNMKAGIDALVRLQKVETEAENNQSKLSSVSYRIESLDARIKEFDLTLNSEEALLDELKKKYHSCESNGQANESGIRKVKEKLRSVKTNKEYQALLKEEEQLKAKASRIDDEMLEYLERIEKVEESLAARKKEYSQLCAQVGRDKELIAQEADQLKKKLVQLDAEWKNISKQVDSELLEKFNRVKLQVRGAAIVPVRNAVCYGCHMNIPPQMYNELQRGDDLKFCPHCQRIIYWENS
jgi:predicted  nucleic acid-binding Zn-ribbon protein